MSVVSLSASLSVFLCLITWPLLDNVYVFMHVPTIVQCVLVYRLFRIRFHAFHYSYWMHISAPASIQCIGAFTSASICHHHAFGHIGTCTCSPIYRHHAFGHIGAFTCSPIYRHHAFGHIDAFTPSAIPRHLSTRSYLVRHPFFASWRQEQRPCKVHTPPVAQSSHR